VAALLVVETLSRSTQLNDRNTKKAHYERLGVRSYWLLNPVQPGELGVHGLHEQGHYQLTAKVYADEVFTAQRLFSVGICPARLLDGLRLPSPVPAR
jgi:Uma2 family endonuclease